MIYTELKELLPELEAPSKRGKQPFKRAFNWGKNLYKADSIKEKIKSLHERVSRAQHRFLVRKKKQFAKQPNIECFSFR